MQKLIIKHRRLFAFYKSTTLNALMMLIVTNLMMIDYFNSLALPSICGGIAFLCFIAYSLWFWIKKPSKIRINSWLSNLSYWFTIYFLIISAMKNPNEWWYGAPIIIFGLTFCIYFIRGCQDDEEFDIEK